MLSSIHPLGERVRGNRWGSTIALFTLAATAGGAATGAVAGTIGWMAGAEGQRASLVAAAAVAAVALAVDASGASRRLARPRRQVDERWLARYRRWVYACGWGVQLGAAVVTVMPAATVALVFVLAALTGSPPWGAGIGAVFGAVRGASLLSAAGVVDPATLRSFHLRMARRSAAAQRAAVAADAVVALTAAAALALPGGLP